MGFRWQVFGSIRSCGAVRAEGDGTEPGVVGAFPLPAEPMPDFSYMVPVVASPVNGAAGVQVEIVQEVTLSGLLRRQRGSLRARRVCVRALRF